MQSASTTSLSFATWRKSQRFFPFAGVLSLLLMPCCPVFAQRNAVPPRVTGARALEAATRLDYLLDGPTAIRLQPSEMAIGQGVTRAEWSPDGRFVLAARIAPMLQPTAAVPVSVALWDKTTRHSRELWSRRLPAPELLGPTQWLADGQVGILRWHWMEADENGAWGIKEGMLWVNTAKGTISEVDAQPNDELSLSPTQTGCVVLHGNPRIALQSVTVIAPDGSPSQNLALPEGVRRCLQTRWQADGKQFYLELDVAAAEGKNEQAKAEDQGFSGPVTKQWFALDMTLARVTPLDKEPAGVPASSGSRAVPNVQPGTGANALRVKSITTALSQGQVETPIHSLWLETTTGAKPMAALLCADGGCGQIAPTGDAVLYLAQTSVWVTMLVRMPRPVFAASVLAPHQDDVKYRAWTLAQAVRMWSEAHKGILPTPNEALPALQSLMPSESLYEGFRYVWMGGALPGGVRPAATVVAEIHGPGGWAQIFADGHSVWKESE